MFFEFEQSEYIAEATKIFLVQRVSWVGGPPGVITDMQNYSLEVSKFEF